MKKIAIFTMNGYHNYGNRLQNYATQEVLKSLGFSVETVINNTKYINESNKSISLIQKLKSITSKEIYMKIKFKLWYYMHKNKVKKYKIKRIEAFKNFTLLNIVETNLNISDDLLDRFEYFVTGSDQVWNPIFRQGSSIDFLSFAPRNKRIAYSPSFGISEIPPEYVEKYTIWLSEMSKLSIREIAGAKIIKDLTGRDAIVLVDPTLMLKKEKWLSISKIASNKPKKEYLLTYFLGVISGENRNTIKKMAEKNRLQIVNLADLRDLKTYIAGPSEFIDYINSASIFCTDSFHGVVFATLMETPFIVFDRKDTLPSMNSRIETLVATLKLESRLSENIKTNEQIFEVDYSHVSQILEVERKKALDYLKEALHVNDEV